MNAWFYRAPWWQLALAFAVPVSVIRIAGRRTLEDSSWTEATVVRGLHGVLFGLVMGVIVARQNRGVRAAAGSEDPEFVVRAAKAAVRGPAPDDPALREAARRIAVHRAGLIRRYRRWAVPFLLILMTLLIGLAVFSGRILPGLVAAGLVGLLAVPLLLLPRHAERRAARLRDPSDRDANPGGMLAR